MKAIAYMKWLIVMVLVFLTSHAYAIDRTQVISLKKGWNAVYLEVDPQVEDQNLSAFILDSTASATIPVEMVATYFDKTNHIDYINDLNEVDWNKSEWKKWIRDDLPDAFLSNLYDLQAGKAYLVKSSSDYEWSVTGEVRRIYPKWYPNAYNLIGFQVSANGPSFHTLFEGSSEASGLTDASIFTLKNNQWETVSLPDTEVKQGQAYWIYNDGTVKFQGKLAVYMQDDPKGRTGLNYLDHIATRSVTLKNTSNRALTATLRLEKNQVPLSLLEKDELEESVYTVVTDLVTTVEIPANESVDVELAVRRDEISDKTEKSGLLKVTVDETYEEFWLPISAYGDLGD